MGGPPVLELKAVSKAYGALRPLRLQRFVMAAGESVAIIGFDRSAAEMLVNLITGATLPEAGEVRIFGRPTSAIADSADWLATVDRFGIVSDRAVLLGQLSAIQNLSMPFTLDVEPPDDEIRARAERLAREAAVPPSAWDRAIAGADANAVARVRLGRALALDPELLLLEHPTAGMTRDVVESLGRDVRAIAARRGVAVLSATADDSFAAAVAGRVLVHNPATGALAERRRGWFAGLR